MAWHTTRESGIRVHVNMKGTPRMARTITASEGTTSPMYRRAADGSLITVFPNRDEYVTPPKGTRCKLELFGISDKFDMPGYDNKEEKQPTVRLEFKIVQGAGNWGKTAGGKVFSELFPLKVSKQSKLGSFLGTLRGSQIEAGENVDIDQFIGALFTTTINHSDSGYPKIGTIEDGSASVPYLGRTDEAPPVEDDDAFGLNNEPEF